MIENLADHIKNLVSMGKKKALLKEHSVIVDRAIKFRAFFENDYEEIKKIIRTELIDKTFSSDTLDKIRFQHLNIIDKPLNRKVAGIYDNEPKRTLVFEKEIIIEAGEDGKAIETEIESEQSKAQNELLNEVLNNFDFNQRVKAALKASEFFNIALAMPVIREENPENQKYSIDILLPDEYVPVTKKDYLLLDKIAIERLDEDRNSYWLIYTEDENYLMDTLGNDRAIDGRKPVKVEGEEKPDYDNVYGIIPIAILRKKTGGDFYGEPNWNLYNSALETDISLTDMRFSETFQHFGIYWGVNTNLPNKTTFSPNSFIDFKHDDPNMPRPELNCLVPGVDFQKLRDNIDWRIDKAQNLEGIPSNSTSTDVNDASGISKEIDEGELNETRLDAIGRCYRFELDLLNVLRTIWNYHNPNNKLDEEAKFEVEYSEEKPHEPVADKKARREMELQYNQATPVDFICEDKECSPEVAEQIYIRNKAFNERNMQKKKSVLDEFLNPSDNGKEKANANS